MLGHLTSQSLVAGWDPAPGEAGGSEGGPGPPVLSPLPGESQAGPQAPFSLV